MPALKDLTPEDKEELPVSYAALALHDAELKISEENISKLLKAAKVEVAPYWPKLFSQLLEGKDVEAMLSAAGGAPGTGGGDGGAEGAGEEKEEEEEEEEDSDDDDEAFDLFD